MNSFNLNSLTIKQALELLDEGKISSVELTQACLERIKKIDPEVKAYLYVNEEWALEQARLADEKRKAGKHGKLLGIPLAIKDNILIKGHPTTCASRSCKTTSLPTMQPLFSSLKKRGQCFLVRQTLMSLPWGHLLRTLPSFLLKTLGIWRGCLVVLQAGQRLL
jgi:Asp-tRNAAsn/Glu-tRNAGln amidotransferase A subunit and related amidases